METVLLHQHSAAAELECKIHTGTCGLVTMAFLKDLNSVKCCVFVRRPRMLGFQLLGKIW